MTDRLAIFPLDLPDQVRKVISHIAVSDRGDVTVVYAAPMIVRQMMMDDDRGILSIPIALRQIGIRAHVAPAPEPLPPNLQAAFDKRMAGVKNPGDLCAACGKPRFRELAAEVLP